jgi:hypothetical protein
MKIEKKGRELLAGHPAEDCGVTLSPDSTPAKPNSQACDQEGEPWST